MGRIAVAGGVPCVGVDIGAGCCVAQLLITDARKSTMLTGATANLGLQHRFRVWPPRLEPGPPNSITPPIIRSLAPMGRNGL
jgi:hypothetical protein